MGKEKGGFLTPKAIANRIKSKGLQKLRWYCQMCQKQCRDENGFKCHMMSESHQRQLLLFADNPHQYIDGFSKEFKDTFLELLKRRFGTKRVLANTVYQEYISDREHTHMNSTQWQSLSEFVKWVGSEGLCVVDETEKGWYMTYIDRNPLTIQKAEAAKNKEKIEMDDEERLQKFISKQIERANEQKTEKPQTEYTELKRENEEEKVAFNFGGAKKVEAAKPAKPTQSNPFDVPDKTEPQPSTSQPPAVTGAIKRKSALDDIIKMEEQKREKQNRKDFWLHEGIVVKVITKKLEKYYKRKGVIVSVEDLFTGVVKMLDTGDKLKLDQAHLETVIPAKGKPVIIVNGAYRGSEAILMNLDAKKFSCTLKISSGALKGRVLDSIQYEDISKLHTS